MLLDAFAHCVLVSPPSTDGSPPCRGIGGRTAALLMLAPDPASCLGPPTFLLPPVAVPEGPPSRCCCCCRAGSLLFAAASWWYLGYLLLRRPAWGGCRCCCCCCCSAKGVQRWTEQPNRCSSNTAASSGIDFFVDPRKSSTWMEHPWSHVLLLLLLMLHLMLRAGEGTLLLGGDKMAMEGCPRAPAGLLLLLLLLLPSSLQD